MADSSAPFCDPDEIVRLVKAGDLGALDRMTRCYGERLLAVGRRACGSDDRARDAVQDALLSAGENLASYRGEGSVQGWLLRMVTNACSRMRRGRKNDPGWSAELDEGTAAIQEMSPAQHAAAAELSELLSRALLQLEPRDRAVLLLTQSDGWTAPEAADALDMTPDAVRTRLSRLRAKLREELGPLWDEWS